jgi:hypothetical protein
VSTSTAACYRSSVAIFSRRPRSRRSTPKTGQGRKIALDTDTVELLAQHRDLWHQRCDELGIALNGDAFVFSPAPDGSVPYLSRAISQRYRRLVLRFICAAPDCTRCGTTPRQSSSLRRRHPNCRWPARAWQRWRDNAEGLRRLGQRGRPARGRHDCGDRAQDPFRRPFRAGRTIPSPTPCASRSLLASSGRATTLPTVVELAVFNAVATETAHRALTMLKNEGLVEVTRGRRATVTRRALVGDASSLQRIDTVNPRSLIKSGSPMGVAPRYSFRRSARAPRPAFGRIAGARRLFRRCATDSSVTISARRSDQEVTSS